MRLNFGAFRKFRGKFVSESTNSNENSIELFDFDWILLRDDLLKSEFKDDRLSFPPSHF